MDFTSLIDSVVNAGEQAGQTLLSNAAKQQLSQGGTSAHIPAQNQTVAAFGTILNEFHAGTLTAAQAADLITRYDQGFSAFCQKLGYARATRGAQDVHNLAVQVMNDNFAGVTGSGAVQAPPGSLPVVPTGVVLPPSTLSAGISFAGMTFSPQTLLLVGGVIYLLNRRRGLF